MMRLLVVSSGMLIPALRKQKIWHVVHRFQISKQELQQSILNVELQIIRFWEVNSEIYLRLGSVLRISQVQVIIGQEVIWSMDLNTKKKLKRKSDKRLKNAIACKGFSFSTHLEEVLVVVQVVISSKIQQKYIPLYLDLVLVYFHLMMMMQLLHHTTQCLHLMSSLKMLIVFCQLIIKHCSIQ